MARYAIRLIPRWIARAGLDYALLARNEPPRL